MVARPNAALAHIHTQVMWSRLIAVVEEQAQTMLRTAFSTSVREAGDLSAGVFDRHGRMLAQAVTGTPGHVNSMANAVRHFLDVYPLATMKPGDHYITNDPWLTSGHLHDITVVTPSFYRGEAVGLFANTIHVVDIGGLGMGPDGRQVFEEGLSIPIMPLAREGRMNDDLLRLVRANVREPLQVEGDIYATAACNDEGSRRLVEMMDEFEIANLDRLGDTIIEASREATLGRIRALPKGTYRNSMTMDGYDKPLVLNAALTISDDGIHVDFDGTSPASSHGINVVYNYCLAYTAFGVKCLVAPEVPNNAGSLAPISVSAPEGCVLNVKRPWPVAARHTVGQMLPDVVFGCLHQVMPVPAEGASSLWNPQIFGGGSLVDEVEEGTDANALPEFSTVIFHCGGAGARPTKDGLSATAFPSGVRTIPVEATESGLPWCSIAANSASAPVVPANSVAASAK
jgi:N-methylhydantoinase B